MVSASLFGDHRTSPLLVVFVQRWRVARLRPEQPDHNVGVQTWAALQVLRVRQPSNQRRRVLRPAVRRIVVMTGCPAQGTADHADQFRVVEQRLDGRSSSEVLGQVRVITAVHVANGLAPTGVVVRRQAVQISHVFRYVLQKYNTTCRCTAE